MDIIDDKTVDQLTAGLTTEQKIGQLFMAGLPGEHLDEKTVQRLHKLHIGSFILFKHNTPDAKTTAALTRSVQREAAGTPTGLPVLFSIDQEMGQVVRLLEGLTLFPANYGLGALDHPQTTQRAAAIVGDELKSLGIHINLAPSADVNSNPDNPIIGIRSFSSDPDRAAKMVESAVHGYLQSGLIPCAKHFPGHGDVNIDSHLDLPVINKSLDQLKKMELIPFQAAIGAGVPMIMTAHILFPALNKTHPATAAPEILDNLLRKQMSFQGAVISDALEMKALTDHYDPGELTVRIVRAGCDLLLFSENMDSQHTLEEIHEEVTGAVREGRISRERLDEAVRRILTLKKMAHFTAVSENELSGRLRLPQNVAFSHEVMTRVLATNEDAAHFPMDLRDKKLLIVTDVQRFSGILPDIQAERLIINSESTTEDINRAAAGADEIWLFVNGRRGLSLTAETGFPEKARVRFFSLNNPYLKEKLPFKTASYLNFFGDKGPLAPVGKFLSGIGKNRDFTYHRLHRRSISGIHYAIGVIISRQCLLSSVSILLINNISTTSTGPAGRIISF